MRYRSIRLVAALVGCVVIAGSARAADPAKVTVMTAVAQGSTTVPVYWIGKDLGFNKEQNIDASVLTVPNGNTAQGAQLVASGQADAFLTSIESVVVPASLGRNTGLVFVYDFYERPQWRLLVPKGSGITSVAQLKGKTVGIPTPGNPAEPMLKAFLTDGGLTMNDVTVQAVGVEIPAAQALKSGQVAAVLAVTLSSAIWQAAGYDFVPLPEPAAFNDLIGPAIAVARTSLNDPAKRDAMVRFLRTLAMSCVFAKTNPKAAIEADYRLFPTAKPRGMSDADGLAQGMRAQASVIDGYTKPFGGRWGAFPPNAFEKYASFLGLKIPNIDTLWTNDLIDDVNKFDAGAVEKQAKAAH